MGTASIRPGRSAKPRDLDFIEVAGMGTPVGARPLSPDGFLLLDCQMKPVFVNRAAAEILLYPRKVEAQKKLDEFLQTKVRSTLLCGQPSREPSVVPRIQSGRRLYMCRAFQVNFPP